MKDAIELVYDCDDAVRFAHDATGIDEDTCAKVLQSRDRFHLGLGIYTDDELFGLTAAEVRRRHPMFFNAGHIEERYVDRRVEHAYIVIESKIDAGIVQSVLDADEEYMRKVFRDEVIAAGP